MKYSFILAARNAEKTLKDSIESLLSVDYPKGKFEVIFINDGSTDRTSKIATSFDNVKVYSQTPKGLSQAYKMGVEQASGQWLVFLGKDQYVSSNILRAMDKTVGDKIKRISFSSALDIQNPTRKERKNHLRSEVRDTIWQSAIRRKYLESFEFDDLNNIDPSISLFSKTDILNKSISMNANNQYFYWKRITESNRISENDLRQQIHLQSSKTINKTMLWDYEDISIYVDLHFKNLKPMMSKMLYKKRGGIIKKTLLVINKLKIFNPILKLLYKK